MTAIPFAEAQPAPPSSRDIAWWGMALLCATEAALFAYLLASYFYLAVQNPAWPPAGYELPKLALPIVMTVLLLSSSAFLYWGERGIKRGDQRRLRWGLGLALLLGLAFLLLQAIEYHEKLQHMGPTAHAYGAMFFTITGFHGSHVAFGLLILLFAELRAFLGHFSATEQRGVQVSSLYWHFVDAVWLVIFASLYLSPYFSR
jgi:heme/copper-type cytochrome/quinol oxidase subunit 3